MNAKQWAFVYWLIEEAMKESYRRGQTDKIAGKTAPEQELTLSKASKLLIKTNFEKISKPSR